MMPCLALALLGPMTGEQVLALVKRTLNDFDVKGPFRVQSLGLYGPSEHPDSWTATVSAPGGARYTAYFSVDGRLRSLERGVRASYKRGALSSADAARMGRWLARIRPRYTVQPWKEQDFAGGRMYQAVVAGYPFVDPRYFYAFTVDKGAFAGFRVYDDPPATGPSVPRVAHADAERAAGAFFRGLLQPGRVEYLLNPRQTRLSWLETPSSPPAILVWRVTGMPRILGGDWTKSPTAVEVYYDAISGRRLERRRP